MAERMIAVNGVELCTEAVGNPEHPTVLCIMGAGGSMVRWDMAFIQRFVDAGFQVIRYDNRDVGRSSCCPVGEPNYTLRDMAADAIAVLDAYGVERAHVMGRSMGGMISQLVSLDYPERVLTASLIYSAPTPRIGGGESDLPGMREDLLEVMRAAPPPDAPEEVRIDHQLRNQRVLHGSRYLFDADAARAQILSERARALNPEASGNHAIAIGNSDPWRHRLPELSLPVLVLHGTDDPILQFPHGEALAAEIAGAKFLPVEGLGHALPEACWDVVIPELLAHLAA